MDTGFYKNEEGNLIYAPNFVSSAMYNISIDEKDTYSYPVYGWYYFDTLEDACTFFGLNPEDYL